MACSKKTNFEDYKYVICIFAKNKHWRLCIATITTKEFYYADPYIATATEIATSFKIWKLFIKSKVTTNGKWKSGTIEHSKQADTYSCGVIVIKISDCF